MTPYTLSEVTPIRTGEADAALLVPASWEDRCTGVAERLHPDYKAERVLVTVYDGISARREKNIRRLKRLLAKVGPVDEIPALHANPITNVRDTIHIFRSLGVKRDFRITIDVTCYTRLHLLQLLQGLELSGFLGNARFLYTQPSDYHTADNEPISKGVTTVRAISTFTGANLPSRDSLLIVFLSYEGRRAEALWDHLEPNQAILVIADPPYKPSWRGRAEEQNRYLLSLVPKDRVKFANAADPSSTESLLSEISADPKFSPGTYNYRIAPLGTKGQVLGIYRYWRQNPRIPTLMYASPVTYRDDKAQFPAAGVVCLDASSEWPPPARMLMP